MGNPDVNSICIHCEVSEDDSPILRLRFKGEQFGICSSCLPVLIHHPERLTGRLMGAEFIKPSTHSHE
jgi:hypothetical protein